MESSKNNLSPLKILGLILVFETSLNVNEINECCSNFDETRLEFLLSLMQTLASQLSSTLMQLLFSFDQDMRVVEALIQTLPSQLSPTLM